jgi:nucleoid-associated protein YgaU
MQMAALMTSPSPEPRCPTGAPTRPDHLTLVPAPATGVGRPPRVSAATYWRRRIVVALGAVALVLVAGKAGAALGGSPLEAPERRPAVTKHVVRSGDSLWSVARHVAPDRDPRPVVDALAAARQDAPLLPGETIEWPE